MPERRTVGFVPRSARPGPARGHLPCATGAASDRAPLQSEPFAEGHRCTLPPSVIRQGDPAGHTPRCPDRCPGA